MSHGKERHEKNCLNCGSIVKGPYCHICGQHNVEPKESMWDLVTHFVYDITHFDGKFFQAIKFLLFKPGFLSKEYMRGRRAAYMNPVRLYVFTSAFFFLVMFSLTKTDEVVSFGNAEKALNEASELRQQLAQATDSASFARIMEQIRSSDSSIVGLEKTGILKEQSDLISDSVRSGILQALSKEDDFTLLRDSLPATVELYNARQEQLPKSERDGWLSRYVARKSIQLRAKYRGRVADMGNDFAEEFVHSIPKMMFVSLPLVAFILWLLYRRKKQYYYTNHAMLVIHDYIAIYLIFLVLYFLKWLRTLIEWKIFSWISVVVALYGFYYVYKSMRNFYEESRGKTILKYSIFMVLVFFLFMFLSFILVVNSLINL